MTHIQNYGIEVPLGRPKIGNRLMLHLLNVKPESQRSERVILTVWVATGFAKSCSERDFEISGP